MQIQQPNIVGNFLNAYQSGLERQEAQKEAERQRMRQDRADQMSEQRFQFDMDAGQLDMALKRGQIMRDELASVPLGDQAAFDAAKQRLSLPIEQGGLGIPPEAMAGKTIADLPRLKFETGETMKELELRLKQAQIAAADRSNRGGGGDGSTILKTAAERAQLAQQMGIDINTPAGKKYVLTGQMTDPATDGSLGKPLSSKIENDLAGLGQKLTDVRGFASTFDDQFAARGVMGVGGDARNWYDRNIGSGSAAANWWQSYDRYKNVVRNELFGAALTVGETANFEKSDINPSMNAATIRANLKRQQEVLEQAAARRSQSLKAQGYNKQAIDLLSGAAPTAPVPQSGLQEGQRGRSKSGKPIIVRNGKWVFE